VSRMLRRYFWLLATIAWCPLVWAAPASQAPRPTAESSSSPLAPAPAPPQQPSAAPGEKSPAPITSTATDAAQGHNDPEVTEPKPVTPVAEASQRFERGLLLFRDGAYELALIEFERAHELVPNYRVLYNIGQVSIVMGRYAKASIALTAYLEQGGAEVDEDRRAAVQGDLKMLDGRTATVLIMSNVDGAEVLLDDEVVAVTPMKKPLLVDAGSHSISVRRAGWTTSTKKVTLAAKDLGRLQLDLEEIRQVQERERVIVERQVAAPVVQPSGLRPLVWIGWSGTAILAVGALATGLVGADAAGNLDNLRKDPTATRSELNDAQSRASTYLLASDILVGSALVLGGVTLYGTLTSSKDSSHPSPPKPTARVMLGPASVLALGTF
jgi:tetratricopeptide (TPR) repeat protein